MPKKKTSEKQGNPVKAKLAHGTKQLETKVTKLLDQAKVKYKVIEHKVVYTAHDAAQTTKKKLGEIAKVVLVKVEGSLEDGPLGAAPRGPSSYFALIVLPAGKYVDFSGIKKALKAKKVSMASEKDITKYLKTKVGLLHPFGMEYKLKTLLDKSMSRAKKMIASAGTYTDSLEFSLKDFEKLVKPIKGAFAKQRR
jgi:prolyl-tRNA editing enzyme YbaK/EbsC (Cys-tRNA(Pro) deacylase)